MRRKKERERKKGRENERRGGEKVEHASVDMEEIRVIRSVTSVNRDRAATGLQVYRTDNADRSIGFSEMQRGG